MMKPPTLRETNYRPDGVCRPGATTRFEISRRRPRTTPPYSQGEE
jgi:hypothetical protein